MGKYKFVSEQTTLVLILRIPQHQHVTKNTGENIFEMTVLVLHVKIINIKNYEQNTVYGINNGANSTFYNATNYTTNSVIILVSSFCENVLNFTTITNNRKTTYRITNTKKITMNSTKITFLVTEQIQNYKTMIQLTLRRTKDSFLKLQMYNYKTQQLQSGNPCTQYYQYVYMLCVQMADWKIRQKLLGNQSKGIGLKNYKSIIIYRQQLKPLSKNKKLYQAALMIMFFILSYVFYLNLKNIIFKLLKEREKQRLDKQRGLKYVEISNFECQICYERPRNIILKPCKHMTLCHVCLKRLETQKCPVCMTRIEDYIEVFIT